ncbi:putative mitochondrial protein AtMg00310 [Silene latifolia]|uniref:putative mitochondrial protein AtMg00310 n=1 Tax=Silene latifolia TaxID=37657 RepID=UPI003D775757
MANSLHTYVMSMFKIPARFCNDLRALVSQFWWGHEERKRGIYWVPWRKLTQPKAMGGMGFRDFALFNLALLGKQAWRLVTNPESLWAHILRTKYYPNGDFMTTGLGCNPSYAWQGIFKARSVLVGGLRRKIGDGLSTRVWTDAWIPHTQSGRVLSPCSPGRENMLVAELLMESGGGWKSDELAALFLPFEQSRIANIRASPNSSHDEWYWQLKKDGSYTVKSARACWGVV